MCERERLRKNIESTTTLRVLENFMSADGCYALKYFFFCFFFLWSELTIPSITWEKQKEWKNVNI